MLLTLELLSSLGYISSLLLPLGQWLLSISNHQIVVFSRFLPGNHLGHSFSSLEELY